MIAKGFAFDERQLLGALRHDLGQVVVRQQRQQKVSGTDLGRAEVDRGDEPGFVQKLGQARRECGRSRVAGLEALDRPRQVAFEARQIDAELRRNAVEIGVGHLGELQQDVLDLDLVVRLGEAEAGRAFERAAGRVVQVTDHRLQVTHGRLPPASRRAR